ncbi:MAG: hypothetical protein AAGA55_07210 [Planctomycetota bacterium]
MSLVALWNGTNLNKQSECSGPSRPRERDIALGFRERAQIAQLDGHALPTAQLLVDRERPRVGVLRRLQIATSPWAELVSPSAPATNRANMDVAWIFNAAACYHAI